jgi:NTE family protein
MTPGAAPIGPPAPELLGEPSRDGHPRTAFVLSGGVSLGALQAGMLWALYEREIVPDLLVGTSAGALNAAFVASRPQSVATARRLAEIWRDLRRDDVFPVSARTLFGGVTGRSDHLVPNAGLRRLIGRHLELDALEQAVVPIHLIVYDLLAGEEVRLSRGPAEAAVLAASSIPGVLPPVRVDGRTLVDGGVVNNTPISHAVELGAERIFVLPTQPATRAIEAPPRGALDSAIHAVNLLVGNRFADDVARFGREVDLIVLPAPNAGHVQLTDFDHADELIAEARAAARSALRTGLPALRAAA